MSVQFNLLPKVKLEYVRARRMKGIMMIVSLIIGGASVAVLLFALSYVDIVQKKSLRDENNDIHQYSTQMKDVKNLNKMLMVQNQLNTLTSLHQNKPVASRLPSYIAQLTPPQASLNSLTMDFTMNSIAMSGVAPSLDTVSLFADTLKAAVYTTDGSSKQKQAFSNVVLSSFGRNNGGATFSFTLSFDPILFNEAYNVGLVVPSSAQQTQTSVFGTGN